MCVHLNPNHLYTNMQILIYIARVHITKIALSVTHL